MGRISEGDWDEDFPGQAALTQANIQRALTSKRGKKSLTELRDALLALQSKRLIDGHLCLDGQVCALGALALHREQQKGFDPIESAALLEQEVLANEYDEDEYELASFGESLGMTRRVAEQVAWENDITYNNWRTLSEDEQNQKRYEYMLRWCESTLARPYSKRGH